ncbi:MAG: hypothetical protein JW841_11625 [Deltaproteobacteria bacterium]|nr:hypothetical protein [Deltaproteobacteria bacterium]
MSNIQVSAMISRETKKRLEQYVRAHGLKKGYVIETALLHHISALESLPTSVLVPSRLVVSQKTGVEIINRINKPGNPTAAMKKLFDKKHNR